MSYRWQNSFSLKENAIAASIVSFVIIFHIIKTQTVVLVSLLCMFEWLESHDALRRILIFFSLVLYIRHNSEITLCDVRRCTYLFSLRLKEFCQRYDIFKGQLSEFWLYGKLWQRKQLMQQWHIYTIYYILKLNIKL
jgi:hypothetical protein